MFSQLAKQSHWRLSADISIADEHNELLMKAMAFKLGNNCQAGYFQGSEYAFRFVTNNRPGSLITY